MKYKKEFDRLIVNIKKNGKAALASKIYGSYYNNKHIPPPKNIINDYGQTIINENDSYVYISPDVTAEALYRKFIREQHGKCFYTRKDINPAIILKQGGIINDNQRMSCDRIDNSLGYSINNIVITTTQLNKDRKNKSFGELCLKHNVPEDVVLDIIDNLNKYKSNYGKIKKYSPIKIKEYDNMKYANKIEQKFFTY